MRTNWLDYLRHENDLVTCFRALGIPKDDARSAADMLAPYLHPHDPEARLACAAAFSNARNAEAAQEVRRERMAAMPIRRKAELLLMAATNVRRRLADRSRRARTLSTSDGWADEQ